jgi:hypothetical protein
VRPTHAHKTTRAKQLNRLSVAAQAAAANCLQEPDLHACIQRTISQHNINGPKKFFIYLHLADQLSQRGDTTTAMHYLLQAQICNHPLNNEELSLVIQRLVQLNHLSLAQSLVMSAALNADHLLHLSADDKQKICAAHKAAHGQDLLLAAVPTYLARVRQNTPHTSPCLLEIGTPLPNEPSPSTTQQLTSFCHKHGLRFETVDIAHAESHLQNQPGEVDFVFINPRDPDHRKHSLANLVCAAQLVKKLSKNGLVCINDTYLHDATWAAKGAQAVPYLLSHGFELVDVRNRAVLLRKSYPALKPLNQPAS